LYSAKNKKERHSQIPVTRLKRAQGRWRYTSSKTKLYSATYTRFPYMVIKVVDRFKLILYIISCPWIIIYNSCNSITVDGSSGSDEPHQDMSSCISEEQVTLHIENCMGCPHFHKWKFKWKFFEVPWDFTCSLYSFFVWPITCRWHVLSEITCENKFFFMSFHLWNHLQVTRPK